MPKIWTDCIARLQSHMPAEEVVAWLKPLHPVVSDNTLKLFAPNRYVRDHVKKNLLSQIEQTLRQMNNGVGLVQVEIGGHSSEPVKKPPPAAIKRGRGRGQGRMQPHRAPAARWTAITLSKIMSKAIPTDWRAPLHNASANIRAGRAPITRCLFTAVSGLAKRI